MKNSNKTILLIHGAWEGAWSWNETVKSLENGGHEVIAIDLPGHGNDKTPLEEITLDLYVNRVKEELIKIGKPVVLVGHSFGGFVVSQVAEDMPKNIEKLIFVASAVPYDGKNAVEVFTADEDSEFLENLIYAEDKKSVSMSRETIQNIVFTGATDAQIDWVLPQLVNQATQPFMESVITTEENFGSVPKAYIGTTLDRVVSPKAQQFTQDFLGIDKDEVVMLPYGHVPLETAPEELANAIKKLATSKVLEKN